MNGRDEHGRFTSGNDFASLGGHARAKALTPEQRKACSSAGFRGLAEKRFGGDVAAAKKYIADLGASSYNSPYPMWNEGFERPTLPGG